MAKRVLSGEASEVASQGGSAGAVKMAAAAPVSPVQMKAVPAARAAGARPEKAAKAPVDDAQKLLDEQQDQSADAKQDQADEPVQLAMMQMDMAFAGTMAAAQEGAPAETTSAPSSSDDGGVSTPLIIGGVLLAGGGIAALAGGGGKKNQAPTVAATAAVTTAEDTAATVTVAGTDPDGDTLTYTAGAATKGTVTGGANGTFTYTPNANFNGTDTFTVTVKDPDGLTATQTVTVTVTAVNDAPTVTATQTVAGTEDTASTITVAGADVDGDTLTYAVTTAAANGTVVAGTAAGTFTYTPNAEFSGTDTFKVTVSDGKGGTAVQTVTVNVAAVNDAPTIDPTATRTLTVAEDSGATEFFIDASDVDSPPASLVPSVSRAPANGTITSTAQGNFYTPNANFSGTDSFDITVTDGAASVTYTVNVTVTPVNDAPVFATPTATVAIDENVPLPTLVYDANATDVDDATLVYSLSGADASFFNIDAVSGEVRFNVPPDFEAKAVYNFNVLATDAAGASGSQAVTVNINNLPDSTSLDVDNDNDPNTPAPFDASAGDVAYSDAAGVANNALITGFTVGDTISVDAAAADYSFANVGGDLQITLNNGGIVSEILIDLNLGNQLVFDEATAEQAVGFDFFQSSVAPPPPPPPLISNLDVDDDNNPNTAAQFNGAGNSVTFTESGTTSNNAAIINFTSDDVILVSNAAAGDYSFASLGNDVEVTFNSPTAGVSTILLVDVLQDNAPLVFDEASAETAVGFDFFQFA